VIEKNLGIIRKIVWSYIHNNPGLEFDDLFAEACLAYLEASSSYNPSKGKKTTFIHHVVTNRINSLISRESTREIKEMEAGMLWLRDEPWTPEQQLIAQENWQRFLERLSPESQAICSLILDETDIYLPTDKPKQCRGIIMRELRSRGWGWSAIWDSFRELKQAVSI
jgi:RNA polymerase sigma factor (sigma-70 family)